MVKSVISMGSNLGDRIENLNVAIRALSLVPGIKVNKVSKFYETRPFKVPDSQDDYINACAEVETNLSALTLLGACLGIEAAMGRVRNYRFCSRIIDIDLLFYGDERRNSKELVIPHPRILERAFVMVPLSDLYEEKKFYDFDFSRQFSEIDKSNIKIL